MVTYVFNVKHYVANRENKPLLSLHLEKNHDYTVKNTLRFTYISDYISIPGVTNGIQIMCYNITQSFPVFPRVDSSCSHYSTCVLFSWPSKLPLSLSILGMSLFLYTSHQLSFHMFLFSCVLSSVPH